jgi:hypothetical protein
MKTSKHISIIHKENWSSALLIFILAGIAFPRHSKSQTITGIEMAQGELVAYQPVENMNAIAYDSRYNDEDENNRFDRAILDYINEMRSDPKAFYQKYVEEYIREKSARFTARYTRSLKKDMLHSPALPLFEPNTTLRKTAHLQLNYLAQYKGRMLTHEQGNIGFAERMNRAGLHCLAENLYAADHPKALDVVLDLLIDEGVPSFGHRKNLMSPVYTHIGIVSETPPGGRMIVVMDFGCKK